MSANPGLMGHAVLGLVVWGLAGCSAPPPQPEPVLPPPSAPASAGATQPRWRPRTPLPPQTMTTDEAMRLRQAMLDEHARNMGLRPPPPTPELVRWVTHEEGIRVMGECLEAKGIPVEWANGRAGYGVKHADAQQSSVATADYQCLAEYSPDPRLSTHTPAQMGIEWDYTSEWLLPCLERLGVPATEALPSREVYVSSGGQWDGYPFQHPRTDEAIRVCPPSPPDLALLGVDY